MAESLKFDLDKMNIRIQVINPGFVKTAATDQNDFKIEERRRTIDKASNKINLLLMFKEKNGDQWTQSKTQTLIESLTILPAHLAHSKTDSNSSFKFLNKISYKWESIQSKIKDWLNWVINKLGLIHKC